MQCSFLVLFLDRPEGSHLKGGIMQPLRCYTSFKLKYVAEATFTIFKYLHCLVDTLTLPSVGDLGSTLAWGGGPLWPQLMYCPRTIPSCRPMWLKICMQTNSMMPNPKIIVRKYENEIQDLILAFFQNLKFFLKIFFLKFHFFL